VGAFGSGDWADVMTRKINTDLCRTLSIRTLKKMGVFDDSSDEVFCVRWVNEFGEDAGKVNIIPQVCVGGNGNKRSLRVEIGGCVTGGGSSVTGQPIALPTAKDFTPRRQIQLARPILTQHPIDHRRTQKPVPNAPIVTGRRRNRYILTGNSRFK